MNRSQTHFLVLQHHFIMIAIVDCALTNIILIDKIVSKNVYVYQRAIEDTIDLLLTKNRTESKLVITATSIEVLQDLKVT